MLGEPIAPQSKRPTEGWFARAVARDAPARGGWGGSEIDPMDQSPD